VPQQAFVPYLNPANHGIQCHAFVLINQEKRENEGEMWF
jgi:hypothetical protein